MQQAGYPKQQRNGSSNNQKLSGPRPPAWYLQIPDSTAAPRQRYAFVEYLRAHGGANDDYDAAELIFGELVTNVFLHAPGPIEVQVEWTSGRATLHVTDEGRPIDLNSDAAADPYAEHGRGLKIVRALSPAVVGAVYPGFGKTITAALPVTAR